MRGQQPHSMDGPCGPAPSLLETKRHGGGGGARFVWLVGTGPGDAERRALVTSVGTAAADLESSGLETPVLAVVGRVVTLHAHLQPRRAGPGEERVHY